MADQVTEKQPASEVAKGKSPVTAAAPAADEQSMEDDESESDDEVCGVRKRDDGDFFL